jgi:hemerythrin-like domain-containing protein
MDPIETLSDEHHLIERYLELLSRAQEALAAGRTVPRAFFEQGVHFARAFVEEYHHFKEEDVLFILLAQKRNGDVSGQIEQLKAQHVLGHTLITRMTHTLHGYRTDRPLEVKSMREGLKTYVDLLRQHLDLEERAIFPLVRQSFTPEEMNLLSAQYEAERRRFGWDALERNRKLLDEMDVALASG